MSSWDMLTNFKLLLDRKYLCNGSNRNISLTFKYGMQSNLEVVI